jgi:hypothetical protein
MQRAKQQAGDSDSIHHSASSGTIIVQEGGDNW